MGFNGVNPWIVKMFDLGWLEIIQWFGVVWIISIEGWIGLGGHNLYRGNGLVGVQVGFWPICRATHDATLVAGLAGPGRGCPRRVHACPPRLEPHVTWTAGCLLVFAAATAAACSPAQQAWGTDRAVASFHFR